MPTATLALATGDGRIATATKLYEFAEIALGCIEKAEKDPECTVNFDYWHCAHGDGYIVGLEGAVLVFGLGVDKSESHRPDDFNGETQSRLSIIEMLGNGDVIGAYYELHGKFPRNSKEANFFIYPYDRSIGDEDGNPATWKRDMWHMIACLKEDDM